MNWSNIWHSIVNFFESNFWNIILFFAVLFLGIVVVKLLMNLIKRILKKTKLERIAQSFICAIIKFLLYFALFMILMNIIGISVTGLFTAMSAVLLAVGLALQNNISNLANGIIIVSSQLLKKGDYISVDGIEGSVEAINFLFVTLVTPDNKKITVPNSTIINGSVTNAGAKSKRRVDFTFSVAYESDVDMVKKIVLDVMTSDGRVLLKPAPFCRLKTLNASSLDFFANCWVDKEDYWDVYYNILETVFNEFKKNNISIPYNQLEIRERKDNVVNPFDSNPLPERKEKDRSKKKDIDLENDDITGIIASKIKKTFHRKDKTKIDSKQKNQDTEKQNNVDTKNMDNSNVTNTIDSVSNTSKLSDKKE